MTTADEVQRPSALAIAIAGSAAVATAFGMARYGYGLLLPDIQDDLALGVAALGAIGTLAYVAYLATTFIVAGSIERLGERVTVVIGGLLAVLGTIAIAFATGPITLGTGVAIAGASAGLVYAPFAEAVDRLEPVVRARTLATINCGTGWGVAVAAPIAIVAGDAWRYSYLGFAGCALLSTLIAARVLPGRTRGSTTHRDIADLALSVSNLSTWVREAMWPMAICSLLIGLGSATFWTFAVDHVRDAGLDQTSGRVLLGIAGVTSITGLVAADLVRRIGSWKTFFITALLEGACIAVIALAGGNVVAVMIAAAVFGFAYNTIVAVTVLWSTHIYSDRPAVGVSVAMGMQGLGLLAGPLTGGLIAASTSLSTALLAGAIILILTIPLAPRHSILRTD